MLLLTLRDGSQVELADATLNNDFIIKCNSNAEFYSVWNKLTVINLSKVSISKDDVIIMKMKDLTLLGAQAVIDIDGTITGHFYYNGTIYTDEENQEYVQAAKILLGEE